MKNAKKTLSLIIAILLVVSLSACGNTQPGTQPNAQPDTTPAQSGQPQAPAPSAEATKDLETTGEPVTIEFYAGSGTDSEIMQKMLDAYVEDNPHVTINSTYLQWTALYSKAVVEASAGAGADIIQVHAQEKAALVRLGFINTDCVNEYAGLNEADYLPLAWQASSINDSLVGIPVELDGYMLWVNADAMKAAGLSEIPTDRDGFIQAMQLMTIDANGKNALDPGFDSTKIVQYGVGMPQSNHHMFYMWFALLAQQGESLVGEDNYTLSFSDEAGIAAAQLMQDFVYKYHIMPKAQSDNFGDFLAGVTATTYAGDWSATMMAGCTFDAFTMKVPTLFGEPAVWGTGTCFLITNKASEDVNKMKEVIKLGKYISECETVAEMGHVPAYIENSALSYDVEGAWAKPFYEAAMAGELAILPDVGKSLQAYSASAPSVILNFANDVMLTQGDCEQAVQTLKSQMGTIITTP